MGWLSTFNARAKEIVIKIRPALLIESADPKALSLGDKELLLRNQASLYNSLRFRGERFYQDDIKRFTHSVNHMNHRGSGLAMPHEQVSF